MPTLSEGLGEGPDALERLGYALRWVILCWILGFWLHWAYRVLKVGAPHSSILRRISPLLDRLQEWIPFWHG